MRKCLLTLFALFFTIHTAQAQTTIPCGTPLNSGNISGNTVNLVAGCTYGLDAGQIEIILPTTINGNGAIISGGGASRVFYTNIYGDLTLNNVTITGGNAGDGGAMFNLGRITANGSTLTGNVSPSQGGVVTNLGVLVINRSYVTNNSADKGGAITNNDGTVNISNTVFTGNSSTGDGSAVYTLNNGTVDLRHVTLAGQGVGTAILSASGGVVNLANSILAGNASGGCALSGGTITDLGGNIEDTNTCGVSGGGINPLLGVGFAPTLDSPAVDYAPNCAGLTSDLVGTPRPQGLACDSGAIEVPVDGEPIPRFNQWNAEYQEEIRAHGWATDDDVYATVHMENGAWQFTPGGIPQALIDYGVLLAVDVWELGGDQFFDHYERVCLLGIGRLIYLDATTSPRQQTEILPVDFENGYTCGWIPNAGTVVLIEPGE